FADADAARAAALRAIGADARLIEADRASALLRLRLDPDDELDTGRHWDRLVYALGGREGDYAHWIAWYEAVRDGWSMPDTDARAKRIFDGLDDATRKDGLALIDALIKGLMAGEGVEEPLPEVPEQAPAPVRVEERDGRVAKASDRDSPLAAAEKDFNQWRMPVRAHLEEVSGPEGEFRSGTNHGRLRARLLALSVSLDGSIEDVKERQFTLGYDVERFEGLIAAYEKGGDDIPALNGDTLADLKVLRASVRLGLGKLERWTEFKRAEANDASGAAQAPPEKLADVVENIAAEMEKKPKYFDPELPRTFRALVEAVRDPGGAAKTLVYGTFKSAENVIIFLSQRALGIGKAGLDGVEQHINKAVAGALLAGFAAYAAQLSGLLPEGWAWLKPLLDALKTLPK
ncbi:MAG TPA: hypothetical protein PKY73_14495, partial [Hyphomonas sp.]|nr:hypothetical protein [Hyphomonas sp.]